MTSEIAWIALDKGTDMTTVTLNDFLQYPHKSIRQNIIDQARELDRTYGKNKNPIGPEPSYAESLLG